MNRYTTKNEDGSYSIDEKLTGEATDRLGAYEDTEFTPNQVLEINDSYGSQIDIANDFMRERDYWQREAITSADKLGKVRLALGKIGITLEEVLEEAESMLDK